MRFWDKVSGTAYPDGAQRNWVYTLSTPSRLGGDVVMAVERLALRLQEVGKLSTVT